MNRIAPRPDTMPKHSMSVIALNSLIIDMKLALQEGRQDGIVNYDRIKELERIVEEMEGCRERTIFY